MSKQNLAHADLHSIYPYEIMSRLKKNIIYNVFGRVSLVILSFVAVKFIYSGLGEDALGLIYFVLTLNALLSFVLEMGITTTTTREVSAHFENDSQPSLKCLCGLRLSAGVIHPLTASA